MRGSCIVSLRGTRDVRDIAIIGEARLEKGTMTLFPVDLGKGF